MLRKSLQKMPFSSKKGGTSTDGPQIEYGNSSYNGHKSTSGNGFCHNFTRDCPRSEPNLA